MVPDRMPPPWMLPGRPRRDGLGGCLQLLGEQARLVVGQVDRGVERVDGEAHLCLMRAGVVLDHVNLSVLRKRLLSGDEQACDAHYSASASTGRGPPRR